MSVSAALLESLPAGNVPRMSTVLVLGADGFIGSHLVDSLLAAGHVVRGFDRFPDGIGRNLGPHPRLEMVQGDFLNRHDLGMALEGIDVVFHLVSLTTPATSGADPSFDVETNVRMSVELFKLCVESGIGRVIFPSSGGAIYGRDSETAFREDDLPLPVSPYAIGKLAIEGYLRFFRQAHGLDSVVLRLSNPYGERQNVEGAQGAIPIFLRRMQMGEPIRIFGDGSMVRDYIHVSDVARMVVSMFDKEVNHALYNLGSGRAASVLEIVDALARITGLEPRVEHLPIRPTDALRAVLDVSRFEDEFGVSAAVGLDDGIARTWRYVESIPARDEPRPA